MRRFLVVSTFVYMLIFLSGCSNKKSELEWSAQIESGNWWDAMEYCENLNEKGKTDWYLPTIDELRTLIGKCEATEPQGFCPVSETNNKLSASDLTADCNGCDNLNGKGHSRLSFRVKGDAWFWSQSSDEKDNLSKAFGVGFERGKINLNQKVKKHYIRCVRSNHPPEKKDPRKDYVTGLKWSKSSEKELWYDEAVSYCENLNEGGESNWRVPNIDELRTLIQNCPLTETGGEVKTSEQNCCLFPSCRIAEKGDTCQKYKDGRYSKFGDTGTFWSSSDVTGTMKKWRVFFEGAVVAYPKFPGLVKSQIRCVINTNQTQEQKPKCPDWSSLSEKEMNYEEAKQYCRNLEEKNYNDWRMPNIDELRTLVQNRKTATDGECKVSAKKHCLYPKCWSFETCAEACKGGWGECESYRYSNDYSKLEDGNVWLWSSSVVPNKEMPWGINFGLGYISGHNKDQANYVRCVRGSSEINQIETIKIGNLQWSNKPEDDEMTYSDAYNYCDDLNEGGYNDWRLPNIDELRTLVKNCPKTETGGECKASEKGDCLTKQCFKSCSCETETENGKGYFNKLLDNTLSYWSSSTLSNDSNFVCIMGFLGNSTYIDFQNKTKLNYGESLNFRCVRKNVSENSSTEKEELKWSEKAPHEMQFNDAKNYCQNLTESGYNDWNLPNIDELRTLIKNSPKTESDGKCRISENKKKLSRRSDFKFSECYNDIKDENNHSKFNDEGKQWSSSIGSDLNDSIWIVDFDSGNIEMGTLIFSWQPSRGVRCVREVK